MKDKWPSAGELFLKEPWWFLYSIFYTLPIMGICILLGFNDVMEGPIAVAQYRKLLDKKGKEKFEKDTEYTLKCMWMYPKTREKILKLMQSSVAPTG